MKKIKFIIGLFLIFVIGSVVSSCSKDDEVSEASLIGTWKCVEVWEDGIREDVESVFPYFIVEENNCYFCLTTSVYSWEEKYKYVFNKSNQTLTVWEWYEDGPNDGYDNEPDDVWSIEKLTSDDLWLELNNGNNLFKFKKIK